jgi:hypothetical protein
MDNSKRQKIQVKLDHPSTPEPEKEVCRKILEEYKDLIPTSSFINSLLSTFSICEQCKNRFDPVGEKALYCPICLAALRKAAE